MTLMLVEEELSFPGPNINPKSRSVLCTLLMKFSSLNSVIFEDGPAR
jgi:hypothetical protein